MMRLPVEMHKRKGENRVQHSKGAAGYDAATTAWNASPAPAQGGGSAARLSVTGSSRKWRVSKSMGDASSRRMRGSGARAKARKKARNDCENTTGERHWGIPTPAKKTAWRRAWCACVAQKRQQGGALLQAAQVKSG
jgi:hypothetical protein